jgi:hypothetical protein
MIRESTNIALNIFEELINMTFTITVAFKVVELMAFIGWTHVAYAPLKLVHIILSLFGLR